MKSALPAIILASLTICIIFFPIPTAYIFAATCLFSANFRQTIAYKILSLCVFLGSSIAISVLLAKREYNAGLEVGYGNDLAHYANAFYSIATDNYDSIFELIVGSTAYTGAAEPIFWIFALILSSITQDFSLAHVVLSLVGFSLIYIGGNVLANNGLFAYLLYSSTITVFVLQGSAIRSGLAFSLIFLASAILVRGSKKLAAVITGLAAFTHFSALPILLVGLLQFVKNSQGRRSLFFLILFIFSSLTVLWLAVSSQDAGLGAKIQARTSERGGDISSIIQFLVEFCFMLYIIRVFKHKIPSSLINGVMTIFVISLVLLFFSPTAFPRFYRYEYIYYILILTGLATQIRPSGGLIMILTAFVWNAFIIASRYAGLFVEGGALDHILFSPFYQ